ncbi:hypothetical protein HYW59_04600 [Candidatus Kaiserbacteria bacterium]|nr:hypothetical protein [Candidatus Kaiserbacteria bacterium]
MNAGLIEVIPTCVPRSAEELANYARTISAFSSAIHIDIVDGLFAPLHTWPYTEHGVFGGFDLSGVTGVTAEIHLMVEEPLDIGTRFASAGAHRVIGHVEAFEDEDHAHSALRAWRHSGAEVGLGVLFDTPLEVLEHHLLTLDVVQMMTIPTIGRQGIPYDESAPSRVGELHARYPELLLSVDGGVSEKNIGELAKAGARRFCAGSAIAKASDPKAAYEKLKGLAEEVLL